MKPKKIYLLIGKYSNGYESVEKAGLKKKDILKYLKERGFRYSNKIRAFVNDDEDEYIIDYVELI